MENKTHLNNAKYINKLNKIKVLNIIRKRHRISRADIAKETKISAPTVTRIVKSLINEEGLVKEIGIGNSSGGRKPTLVEFAAEDNFVIGIDLGRTHIDGVLSNLNAETVSVMRKEIELNDDFDTIMNKTAQIISSLSKEPKVKNNRIYGVGMAIPGLINKRQNILEFSPDFHWENVDIIKSLQKSCKLPIKFDNMTRVMALGELWYGVGTNVRNLIVVNIGYGIGAGIIIDNKPLYGPLGMAGEFGHMTMDKNNMNLCDCGNFGCLEAISSGRAIAERVIKDIKNGKKTIISDWIKNDYNLVSAKMVAEAVREGDKLASKVFYEAIEYLAIAIANVINLISTDYVLIGGGVAESHDLIFDKVRKIVNERSLKVKGKRVTIEKVTFGLNAATKGAVALILKDVLKLELQKN